MTDDDRVFIGVDVGGDGAPAYHIERYGSTFIADEHGSRRIPPGEQDPFRDLTRPFHASGPARDFTDDVMLPSLARLAQAFSRRSRELIFQPPEDRPHDHGPHLATKERTMAHHNPYRPRDGQATEALPVRGFDLDDLDELLRSHWHEGYREGEVAGTRTAESRYEGIFDEGHEAGIHAERRATAERFGDRLHAAHELATGLIHLDEQSPDKLRQALDTLGGILEQVMDDHRTGRQREDPDTPPQRPLGLGALGGVGGAVDHRLRYLRAWLNEQAE